MAKKQPKKAKATGSKKNVRLLTPEERDECERVGVLWRRFKKKEGMTQEEMGKRLGYKFGQSGFGGYLNTTYTPAINERFILDFCKITGDHPTDIRPSMADNPVFKTPYQEEILDILDAMPPEERDAIVAYLKTRKLKNDTDTSDAS